MLIGFYTIRIVLDILGVKDFGIFTLVGSFVGILVFLNTTLRSATERFLTFELGKNNFVKLKQVFSIALSIHISLAIIIFIFAETVGLWFLYEKMNIPVERLDTAFWVYQLSIFSSMIAITQVPYNALIIAHERMYIFAYISIVEALLKLSLVYLLTVSSYDKLLTYAILMFLVSLIVALFYRIYCNNHYTESHYKFYYDKKQVKSMLNFSAWTLFGSVAWTIMNYGTNVILNIFYGPSLVAARAISMQVNNSLNNLVTGFRTALNPQIIKMCSIGNYDEMKNLTFQGAKYSFYLSLILVLPVFIEIENILNLWLVEIPDWAVEFCRLILVFTLIQTFDMSFGIVFQALEKIKLNQILSGGVYLLVLPIYIVLEKLNIANEVTVLYVQICAGLIVSFVVKVYLLRKYLGVSILEYMIKVIFPIFKVLFLLLILVLIIYYFNFHYIINLILLPLTIMTLVLYIDVDIDTRKKIFLKIQTKLTRK